MEELRPAEITENEGMGNLLSRRWIGGRRSGGTSEEEAGQLFDEVAQSNGLQIDRLVASVWVFCVCKVCALRQHHSDVEVQ